MQNTDLAGQSLSSWFLHSLGTEYAILLPLAGMISFFLALLIVVRGKGPLASAGLLLVVHVPLLVGVFAAIQGMITELWVISPSTIAVKHGELAGAITSVLVAPLFGMILMVPGYAIAALGAVIRSLLGESTVR